MPDYIYYTLTLFLFGIYIIYMTHCCIRYYLVDANHVFRFSAIFDSKNLFFFLVYGSFTYINFLSGYVYLVGLLVGTIPLVFLFTLATPKRDFMEGVYYRREDDS